MSLIYHTTGVMYITLRLYTQYDKEGLASVTEATYG